MAAALTLNSAGDRWDLTLYAAPLPNELPARPSKLVLESFITVLILAFQYNSCSGQSVWLIGTDMIENRT